MPLAEYQADGADYGYPAAAFNVDAESKKNLYLNPNLFVNYTKGKMAFGFGVFVPAGLGVEYEGADLAPLTGGVETEWMSQIGAINISPAFAYQMTDAWSLGVAANVYYGMFELKRPAVVPNVGVFQYSEESTGLGYGATVGSKWMLNKAISLGLTVRTPVKVVMSGEAENPAFAAFGAPKSDFDRDVTWPMWIAGGFAFHLNEKTVFTMDAQWSQWSTMDKLVTEYDDAAWVAGTEPTGDNEFILNWDDQVQWRLGVEYQARPCLALRTGFYYDPAPANDETLNILFPSSTNSVLTGGFSFNKGKFIVDAGAEYIFGVERNAKLAEHNQPGTHHMDIMAFSVGLGYKF
jgi:long-chain fatty acid transport protein